MFGMKSDSLTTMERNTINAAARVRQTRPVAPPVAEPIKPAEPPALAVPAAALIQSRVEALAEYAKLAAEIGVAVPELEIEEFVAVLEMLNFPVYSLPEVRLYMDDKAKREGLGYGWRWYPLRNKDRFPGEFDGDPSGWQRDVASDIYRSVGRNGEQVPLYRHTVPLHALKRIAAIEKEYTSKPVHFLVTDYATAPERNPDPFLLAVLPNPRMSEGVGRFVIDFWDEPGFGIAQMLK